MRYAIIKNRKYEYGKLYLVYRHNERKNTNYSNREIDLKCHDNFHIKECSKPYSTMVKQLIKENNLKGQFQKRSKVACEYIITSSREFFDDLSMEEIKKFFEVSYKFVASYKGLGEENILSAVVHMDETTPHMHLVYLPVVHKLDTKSGKEISKLCCSDFWDDRFSYKKLQDDYYDYITKAGYEMNRGKSKGTSSVDMAEYKRITSYELQKYNKKLLDIECDIHSIDVDKESNMDRIKEEYKRAIRSYNRVAAKYSRIKTINDKAIDKMEEQMNESDRINKENIKLKNRNKELEEYIEKAFECISIMFDCPEDRLKNVVKGFIDGKRSMESKQNTIETMR